MATNASGDFTVSLKNRMLDLGLGGVQDLRLQALNASNQSRSDTQVITLTSASNGKRTLSTPVTLTVTSGSENANAVSKIRFFSNSPSLTWVDFVLDTAINFPAGGNLVINQLDVELVDEA